MQAGQVFNGLKKIIAVRKNNPALSGNQTDFIDTGNPAVFGFLRTGGGQRVLVLANFSEREQIIPANLLRMYGLWYQYIDLMTRGTFAPEDFKMEAYRFLCVLME